MPTPRFTLFSILSICVAFVPIALSESSTSPPPASDPILREATAGESSAPPPSETGTAPTPPTEDEPTITGPLVMLNEIVASNSGTFVRDSEGDAGDWIEIVNHGDTSVNLEGWGLSDRSAVPFRWRFPEVDLEPGAKVLVWADGKDRDGRATRTIPLISPGSQWRYLDGEGPFPDDDWHNPEFDDEDWRVGPAPLGYSDGAAYLRTVLDYGGDPDSKHPTALLRKRFQVSEWGAEISPTSLIVRARIADGAVVYINGVRRISINLPEDDITYETPATEEVGLQSTWREFQIPASALRAGENVITVQIHRHDPSGGEFLFDLSVSALVVKRTFHTNFSISSGGEHISLNRPDGFRVDEVAVPALPRDVAYGRGDDGEWYYFGEPTPWRPNDTEAFTGILHPPEFSVAPGFHDGPVELALSHPDDGVEIRFTIDGSHPGESEEVYTGPITLRSRAGEAPAIARIRTNPPESAQHGFEWRDAPATIAMGHAVRALATKPGYLSLEPRSGTWFVGSETDEFRSVDVVSLIAAPRDFFDHVEGIYVPGALYDEYGYGEDWWGMPGANYFQRGPAWERDAHFELFAEESGDRLTFGDLRVRIHGTGSRVMPQKSLRLYDRKLGNGPGLRRFPVFDELPHTEYRRVLLRNSGQDWYFQNPTMLRDAYMQRLVRHLDFSYQAYRPTALFLNGEFWGIHNLRERIDRHFLANRYGVDPDSVDLLANNSVAGEGTADHYLETLSYIREGSLEDASRYAYVRERIDVVSYADYIIAQTFFANADWPWNNVEFWRLQTEYHPGESPGHDGRWRWIFSDLDFAGNADHIGVDMFDILRNPVEGGDPPPWSVELINALWENSEFVREFCNRYATHLNTALRPERSVALLDEMAASIESIIEPHFQRWGRDTDLSEWRDNLDALRGFVENRPPQVWNHLNNHFATGSPRSFTIRNQSPARGAIHIHGIPIDGALTPGVDGRPTQWTGTYFQRLMVTVEAVPDPGYRFDGWAEFTGGGSAKVTVPLEFFPVLTARFEEEEGEAALLHYWSFNKPLALQAPAFSVGDASMTWTPGTKTEFTYDTGQGFSGENARLSEGTGTHLRVNDPLGSSITFRLPTTNRNDTGFRLKYEARRSGQGAGVQQIAYSLDGETFVPFREVFLADAAPSAVELNFSGIEGVAENPDFAVRITFRQGSDGGSSGNNRIDNLTFEGLDVPAFWDPFVTDDLGFGWRWNPGLGHIYAAEFPVIYSYGLGDWIYILGETETSYYFWTYTHASWGWTGSETYPYYFLFGEDGTGSWSTGGLWE